MKRFLALAMMISLSTPTTSYSLEIKKITLIHKGEESPFEGALMPNETLRELLTYKGKYDIDHAYILNPPACVPDLGEVASLHVTGYLVAGSLGLLAGVLLSVLTQHH